MSFVYVIGDPRTHAMELPEGEDADITSGTKSSLRAKRLLGGEYLSDAKFKVGPHDETPCVYFSTFREIEQTLTFSHLPIHLLLIIN
jgi:hypothetical protein